MKDSGYSSLLREIPHVLRARGYRLYTQGGKRLIDLWLNGGAAVLGHTPPNFLLEIKNTASRGLYAPFPHFTENRFLKALSKLLPDYKFRLYASPPAELLQFGKKINIWRPFINETEQFTGSDFLALVLPGIQTWREYTDNENIANIILPLGLCVVASKSETLLAQLPENDLLPPVLLAASARGVYDIIASNSQSGKPARDKPLLPQTFKALRANQYWVRDSIYLTPKKKPNNEGWATLFKKFLDEGFLLPPTPLYPLILPGELSKGEDVKLAGVLKD